MVSFKGIPILFFTRQETFPEVDFWLAQFLVWVSFYGEEISYAPIHGSTLFSPYRNYSVEKAVT